jgi:hypothetical protein
MSIQVVGTSFKQQKKSAQSERQEIPRSPSTAIFFIPSKQSYSHCYFEQSYGRREFFYITQLKATSSL